MEYWLKNKDKSIQLPIRPASFDVTFENTHQTVNVQTRGDVTILGKKDLKRIRLSLFFRHRTTLLQTMQKTEILGSM